jgi:hypothetical protein
MSCHNSGTGIGDVDRNRAGSSGKSYSRETKERQEGKDLPALFTEDAILERVVIHLYR